MLSQEIKAQFDGSQSYEAELVTPGCVDENGNPLPLDEELLAKIRSMRPKLNILHVAPPDTDLEGDQHASDNTMWARTSLSGFLDLIAEIPIELVVAVRYKYTANRPSHLVVFGPGDFHLCSCLQLLRHGLPCRHYFAALVNLIGRTRGPDEISFNHAFNGACVHNRWRRSEAGSDLPWSVSKTLTSSGHGVGWDGQHEGDDKNYWGPTCDGNSDGVHPSEPAARAAQDRDASDKRRVYACMMAKGKDLVEEIMRSVPLSQALSVQEKVEEYARFLLAEFGGSTCVKNPAKPPKKGRSKKDDRSQPPQHRTGVEEEPRNPKGQQGSSRQTRRMRDFGDSRRPAKRTKSAADNSAAGGIPGS